MRERLEAMGLTKLEFHIDWHPDYKCIDIQGRRDRLYVDIQIEPGSFTIAMDEDEPDDPTEYALVSAECFYDTLRKAL
jgi:predicted RNA-binding protein associated with RNAse of E/G family